MAGYILRWFALLQMVNHPSINWARHRVATLIETNAATTKPGHDLAMAMIFVVTCCWSQEAEKEAELARQKKADKAEKKKQAKNKTKTSQDTRPSQTELRPYTRTRPIGQTRKQDDQSETRAPAAAGTSPAVYVRGQKRKVSERDFF